MISAQNTANKNMRLYSANIEDFYTHVRDNTLADTIRDNFKAHLGRYPGIPEYNSFNPNSAGIPREAGGGPSAMRARPDGVRPGFRARHNYASRPGRKAGGDFSSKIAEAGSRKTAMRFMRDYASRRDSTGPFAMPWETHDKVKPPEGYVKWFEWAFKPEGIKQVGCIYTAQGFEFDYIGVIIGKDFVYDPLQKKMTGNRIASFDRTLRQNAANFTEYARNIYRVLLSRGMKGAHFLSRIDSELAGTEPVTAAAPASLAEKLKQALDILPQIPAALRWTDYLPVYSLQAACGNFGRGMAVEPLGWIKCPPGLKPDRNMFAAQVAGRSMEPRLQDGDYCVFRANPGGTAPSIADPDTGGSYTINPNSACGITRAAGGGPSTMRARPDGVYASRRAPAMRAENFIRSFQAKKYTSKKKYAPDGAWQHEEIILKPLNPSYAPIVIPNAEDEEFMVIAEVVGKCGEE